MQTDQSRRKAVLYGVISTSRLKWWAPPAITAVLLPSHAHATTDPDPPPELPPGEPAECVYEETHVASKPEERITWADTLVVPQYDGPGQLGKVTVTITGSMRAEVSLENLDQQPQTYTSTLDTELAVSGPGGVSMTLPVMDAQVIDLDAQDGTTDFGGPAGTEYEQLKSDSMSTTVADVTPFEGSGFVSFNANAGGSITISGSSAVASITLAFAAAEIEVTYECA